MSHAIPALWKCSECSLEYETEEEATECCEVVSEEVVSEDEEVENNDEEIDESDDDEEIEVE